MNIIIVGAGKVGYKVAEVLSARNDVMIIENDPSIAERLKSLLNVSVFNENGSNPKVLGEAISRHQADVIISTTHLDGVNLYICMLAKQLKPSIRTIARIIDPDYDLNSQSSDMTGIDHIFSPELLCANTIASMAVLENAVEFESIESLDMGLATFLVTAEHTNIIGKVVMGLDMPPDTTAVAIYRGDDVIMENETVELHEGDRICVLGSKKGIEAFNEMMGVAREATEFVVLGASVTGIHTARFLESKNRYVKLIESDPEVCRKLARQFSNVIIVNGNVVDPHLLKMENIGRSDVLIALGATDETNLLACLMGNKLGARKIISMYSMNEYEDIFDFTGIPSTIGYHRVVANEITKTLVSDEESILQMKYPGELFFSIIVNDKSEAANQRVGDVRLPPGCRVACIVRGEEKIYPRMDTLYMPGDKLLMFTYNVKMNRLEKLFRTQINYAV